MKKELIMCCVAVLTVFVSCNKDTSQKEQNQSNYRLPDEEIILLKENITEPFVGRISDLGLDSNLCYDILEAYFPELNPSEPEITQGEDGTYYLFAKDCTEGDCAIMRVSLEVSNRNLYLNRSLAIGETCTGNPCQHCTFKEGGGCKCNDTDPNYPSNPSTGKCNHTITRLTQFFE